MADIELETQDHRTNRPTPESSGEDAVPPPESYNISPDRVQGENTPRRKARKSEFDGTVKTQEEYEEELELIYGARHVIMIFVPVTLCMLVVSVTISSISFFATNEEGNYLIYTPFHPEDTDTGGVTLVKSVLNSLIILAVVVVMTFFLILLYKLKCYCIIHGWIMLSSLMLLFLFAFIYLQELLKAYLVPMDLISTVFCIYNFGVTGMFAIHWKGPLIVQQGYLIMSSALMSLIFIKYLPEWTLWFVLGVIACWDLFAVLAPHGPLKMLVETAQERGDNIMPALIYSSTVVYPFVTMADAPDNAVAQGAEQVPGTSKAEHDATANPDDVEVQVEKGKRGCKGKKKKLSAEERIAKLEDDIEEEAERGVKLGLGDFIFYSVLVGKASASRDVATTLACFLAILMGLFLTLAILVTVRKALPALPISIFFGLIFNFGTNYLITPMMEELSRNQVFL